MSEANSRAGHKNEDLRSIRSVDRYSRVSQEKFSTSNAGAKRSTAKSLYRKKNSEQASSISDIMGQTQKANKLGRNMETDLMQEAGKLGMQWVAHDKIVDD
jgi:hypothetical protein